MPIKIPQTLPAAGILESENIFVMDVKRADTQDIRPLKIAILNLMPTKIVTETQLLRLLSNTPLQIDVTLLTTATYTSKNTDKSHLDAFYKTFDEVKSVKFDGLIITGAPVEYLEFDKVSYWQELCEIIDWANANVFSTLYVCWGAFAGLYHNYGIEKYPLSVKISGVYRHHTLIPSHPLVRGFDEYFNAPHSRFSYVLRDDIISCSDLELLAESDDAGVYLAASKDMRHVRIRMKWYRILDMIRKRIWKIRPDLYFARMELVLLFPGIRWKIICICKVVWIWMNWTVKAGMRMWKVRKIRVQRWITQTFPEISVEKTESFLTAEAMKKRKNCRLFLNVLLGR